MDNLNNWPSTNIHELNLDWTIAKVKELDKRFTDDIETFVREYIDEHFAEWTVNANYDPDDETIIYTNGTGATLTAGDVIRFAIDNAYVNVKDPTARTAASNAATAAAAAQSTADTNTGAISAMDTAYRAADSALSTRIDAKTTHIMLGDIPNVSTAKDAILAAFNMLSETFAPVTIAFGYTGTWTGIAYKYAGGQYGCMFVMHYSEYTGYIFNMIGGTPHLHVLSGNDIPY